MNDGAVVNEDDDTAWIYTMLTIDVLKKNHLKKKKKNCMSQDYVSFSLSSVRYWLFRFSSCPYTLTRFVSCSA